MRLPRVDQVLVRQLSAAVLNRHARQVPSVRLYALALLLFGLLAFGLSGLVVKTGWASPAERAANKVKQAVVKTIGRTAAYTGVSLSSLLARDISATPVSTVSAASFEAVVAPDALVSSFGVNLATQTVIGSDIDPNPSVIQFPTQLGGTTVEVNGRRAQLLFVSQGQINYLIPSATEYGTANIVVRSSDSTVSNGTVQVAQVAPSIFTANGSGRGVAAAVALRVRENGSQVFEPVAQYNASLGSIVTKPIDLGPTSDTVFLVLYATGLRNADDPNNDRNLKESFSVLIGGIQVAPAFVGPAPGLIGVDQVNVVIPRSLIGRGVINVSVSADGFGTSNAITIEIAGGAGVAPPQITGFNGAPALAGSEVDIMGSGFSTRKEDNIVRFGSTEAAVMEALPTKLKVIVPYGAETGTITVRTPQGEGVSTSELRIRTSISGSVEDTNRQPLGNVAVRLLGTNPLIATSTRADGSFVLPDVPAAAHLVEVDGGSIPTQPPYPIVRFKFTATPNRDNQIARAIPLQQATGASGNVGGGSPIAEESLNLRAANAQQQPQPTSTLLQTGKFSLVLPNTLSVTFPDRSTSGKIYLTPLQDARTPVKMPESIFSTSIAQITPFETKFAPGAKLILPNSDGLSANSRLKLFHYDKNLGGFEPVEGATVTVSADGQYLETGEHDIKEGNYYFAAIPRVTTDVKGRVLCCMTANGTVTSSIPIVKGFVESRGQAEFTDGNGAYVLRNVAVSIGENVSVGVTYIRPTGRVDRAQSRATPGILRGLTAVEDVYLLSENSNRPPVILAPIEVEVAAGQSLDIPISIYDPDPDQQVSASVEGASFATLIKLSGGGTISNPNAYLLRLAPTQSGKFNLNLTATDGQATVGKNIIVSVPGSNRAPKANDQDLTTDEDTPLSIRLTGSDPDNNSLQYSIVRPPLNGTLSGRVPNLTYTPQANFNGSDSFSFKVNDGQVDSLPAIVKITIRSVNDPPVLTLPTLPVVNEGQLLTINLNATDPDQGQTLTLTALNLPAGAEFTVISPTSAQFKWTPSFTQSGVYLPIFRVSDNGTPPLSDTEELRITVVDAPVLSVPGPQTVNEGQTLVFDLALAAGQGNTLTSNNMPMGAALNATSTGGWQFKWTPTFSQAGNYIVTFRATTSSSSESKDVRITVFDVQHELGKEPNELTIWGAHSPATRDPLDAGDATGVSVAAGDISGDGIADLIIGAPAANNGVQDVGRDVGKVYVFFGKATLTGSLDLAQQKPDVTLIGERSYDAFGTSVAVGDVNGDGRPDLIIGAPLADTNTRRDCGKVYIVPGNFPPTGLDADKTAIINRVASLTITGANAEDKLGTNVAAGNVRTRFSSMDLLASAPGLDVRLDLTSLTLKDAGAVYLFAGGATLTGERDLANTAATATLTGVAQEAQLGLSLAVGNFNGDDYSDLAVGAPFESTTLGKTSGKVYLLPGGGNLAGTIRALPPEVSFVTGTSEGDNLGTDVALGDLNGDGFADLVAGAPGGDGPGNARPNTGEVLVFFGAAGISSRTMLIQGAGRRDDSNADALGTTLAIGDFNGDGIADLLMGAPGADISTDNRSPLGAAYLIFGSRTALPTTYDLATRAADLTVFGALPGDRLGLGGLAFGNVNGSETADLVLGIPRSASINNSRLEAGEVRVLFGVRR
jgi:uncharacterized protein (TIGR03437 family)